MSLMPISLRAQDLTNADRRRINSAILRAVEEYESNAMLSDENSNYTFRQICTDSTMIYSDLLEYRQGQSISMNEYIEQMSQRDNVTYKIKNVRRTEPVYKNDLWHVLVKFDKSLFYTDVNGVFFSSEEYYKSDYELSLDMIYDKESDVCKITDIKGRLKSDISPLPDKFAVIQKSDDRDDRVRYDDEYIAFNGFDQAFVTEANVQGNKFGGWNDDIKVTLSKVPNQSSTNYDLMTLSYKRTHWRAKVRAAMSLGDALNMSSSNSLVREYASSSAFEVGADIGYSIPMGRLASLSIYTGIAMSTTQLSFDASFDTDNTYTLNCSIRDSDNDITYYERHYEISKATEGVKYNDIVVPVYLSIDHRLGHRRLWLSWMLGAKYYIEASTSSEQLHITGKVGDKSAQENLTPINGNQPYSEFLFASGYRDSSISVSVVGGLAVNYKVTKNRPIYAFAKYSYEYGLDNIHESDNNPYYDKSSKNYPLVYSAKKGDVATRSFMDCTTFSRQMSWLEVGVMFKF